MTSPDDVAGLLHDLDRALNRAGDEWFYRPMVMRAKSALESQANALREMEAERDRTARNRDMWKGQVERQAEQLTTLRARLKEAEKVIEPFSYYFDLNDCAERGGDDALEIPIRDLRAARAFIIEGGK